MDVGALIKVVGGLLVLVVGVRQALRLPLRRRAGVYAPVVAFRDEYGTEREFTPRTARCGSSARASAPSSSWWDC